MSTDVLLQADDVSVEFPGRRQGGVLFGRRRPLRAVDQVNLTIRQGETVGLAGESGSGKTTLGYAILGRYQLSGGRIRFDGTDITRLTAKQLRQKRQRMQMIFQDPYTSLNPRMKVEDIVGEPLIVHGLAEGQTQLRTQVQRLLERCGLPAEAAERYPRAFSGGQRQRIGIARALALSPSLIVADEPTSALDVSIQAQIINLLRELQLEFGIAYLFISHNLAVLRQIADRVAIMYLGQIVEHGPTEEVFQKPQHPYTQALLRAIPVPDPTANSFLEHEPLTGELPSPTEPPAGCRFNTRCPVSTDVCFEEQPPFDYVDNPEHVASCWRIPAALPSSLRKPLGEDGQNRMDGTRAGFAAPVMNPSQDRV